MGTTPFIPKKERLREAAQWGGGPRARGRLSAFQSWCCVSLGSLRSLPEPQLPHLQNGVSTGTHATGPTSFPWELGACEA